MILETERLLLRKLTQNDFSDLCSILQDPAVMYAYEHAFSNQEVQNWLDNQLRRYREDGYGLWAVILKDTGELIGQAGLTNQSCEGETLLEIGYLFQKAHWHHGYATEAAIACKEYAFQTLARDCVCSIIRDNNFPSQRVARRNGMTPDKIFIKHYYGIDMPHIVFSVSRNNDN